MQCRDLESVLESDGLTPLNEEAREHLAGCPSCQGVLADFETIVSIAHTLPAEIEPPQRVWVSLRAQLEAEGLIKEEIEVAPSVQPASWWPSWLRPRSLVTVGAAAAILIAVAVVMRTPPSVTNIATRQTPSVTQPAAQAPATQSAMLPAAPQTSAAPAIAASASPSGPAPSRVRELAPSPSENASTAASVALNEFEHFVPSSPLENAQVDASFRKNLRALNEFIAECEQRLRQNPDDELAREYLNTAYQQKADLLAAMMDSGRSEH